MSEPPSWLVTRIEVQVVDWTFGPINIPPKTYRGARGEAERKDVDGG